MRQRSRDLPDPAVVGKVNVVLLNECLALRGTESSVREHALLLDDVVPSAGRAGSDEAVSECLARLLDA